MPPRAWRGAARGQTSERRHEQHAAMRASPSSSYRLTPSTRSGAAACTPTMLPRLGSGMRSHSRACHRTRIVSSEGSERWYERSASATAVLRVRRRASKSCRYARIPRKRPSGTPECKNWTAREVRHGSMSGLCLTWATAVQLATADCRACKSRSWGDQRRSWGMSRAAPPLCARASHGTARPDPQSTTKLPRQMGHVAPERFGVAARLPVTTR